MYSSEKETAIATTTTTLLRGGREEVSLDTKII
jgi:hypothetical protein